MENIQLKLLFEGLRHESWVSSRFTHKAPSLQPGNNTPQVPLADMGLVLQDVFRAGSNQAAGRGQPENTLVHLHPVVSQLPEELR